MRAVDADALEKYLNARVANLRKKYGNYDAYTNGVDDALTVIEEAPTLTLDDLRPKGEWNIFEHDHEFYAECPECKHIRAAHDAIEMNFCPCCGMDIDGRRRMNWISVKERLPQDEKPVLTYYGFDHWMPLPEPPKEEA